MHRILRTTVKWIKKMDAQKSGYQTVGGRYVRVLVLYTDGFYFSSAASYFPPNPSNVLSLKKKGKLSLDLLKQQFQYFISFFANGYTDTNAKH